MKRYVVRATLNSSPPVYTITADYFDTLGGELCFYKNFTTESVSDERLVAAFATGLWAAVWEVEDDG